MTGVGIPRHSLAPDLTVREVQSSLDILSLLQIDKPPLTIEKLNSGWIRLDNEAPTPRQESNLEFKLEGDGIRLRNARISNNRQELSDKRVNKMIADSFSRLWNSGYRSCGFDMWLRSDREGWLVVWAKFPRRFHDERHVCYTTDMVFENISGNQPLVSTKRRDSYDRS